MKLGIALDPTVIRPDDIARYAQIVDDSAIDLLWLEAPPDRTAAVVTAAASLAGTTRRVTIGGRLYLDDSHPIYTAEDSAVLDNLLGGRWIAGLAPAPGHEHTFDEAARIVLAAGQSTPFAHRGAVWTVPARLPANSHAHDDAVLVTPSRLRSDGTWILADSLPTERGARPAIIDVSSVDGPDAVMRVVDELRRAGRERGVETAILRIPAPDMSEQTIHTIAGRIRAAVQLPSLPPGLEQYWDRHTLDEELESIDV